MDKKKLSKVCFRKQCKQQWNIWGKFAACSYLLQSSGHSTLLTWWKLLTLVIKAVKKDAWECDIPVTATVVMVWLWWTFEITVNHCLHRSDIIVCDLLYSKPIIICNSLLCSYINPLTLYFLSIYPEEEDGKFLNIACNFYQFYMILDPEDSTVMKCVSFKGDLIYLFWYLLCARMGRLWPTCEIQAPRQKWLFFNGSKISDNCTRNSVNLQWDYFGAMPMHSPSTRCAYCGILSFSLVQMENYWPVYSVCLPLIDYLHTTQGLESSLSRHTKHLPLCHGVELCVKSVFSVLH